MRAIYLGLLYFVLITAFGCKKIALDPPENLFEKYKKSVVLIKNKYYYQVDLSNGMNAYFTELENGDISDLT